MLNEAYLLFTTLIVFQPDPWEPWHIFPDCTWLQNFYQAHVFTAIVTFSLFGISTLSSVASVKWHLSFFQTQFFHFSCFHLCPWNPALTVVINVMDVRSTINSACHLLSLCHHYTSASVVVEFKWGKHFFSHWTPFLTAPSLHCSSCTSACLMNGIWPTHHLLHFNPVTSVASRLEMKCMTNTEAAGQDTLLTEHTSQCWQTVKLGNYSMLVFLPSIL